MRHPFLLAIAIPATIALGLAGCSGGGSHDTAAPSEDACDDGSPVDVYVAGIGKDTTEGAYSVSIVSATPSPPDVGDNEWTLSVTDAAGNPVTGGTVTITPWMPLHGHGTTPTEYAATSNGDGTWEMSGMDLFMAGLWELTVEVSDGSVTDGALFRFCLEG